MEDNLVNSIIDLHKENQWKTIVDNYYDHPERSKILWVFPDEKNLHFIRTCLEELKCNKIVSIGCGSGLLEWIIKQATGLQVTGVEIDGAWWRCKYAPPTFIPLLFTQPEIDEDVKSELNTACTALMLCYFNNRAAYESYLKCFSGSVMIIIGPGDGKGVHTDPRPFGDVTDAWKLHKWQEVRTSMDFIAVYIKNKHSM